MVALSFLSCCYLSMTMSQSPKLQLPQRMPTVRQLSTSNGSTASPTSSTQLSLSDRAQAMQHRAQQRLPLTTDEITALLDSLDNVRPCDYDISRDNLTKLLQTAAHLPHTDWASTGKNADQLGDILLKSASSSNNSLHDTAALRQVLERVLRDGNWDAAYDHAQQHVIDEAKPWIVLVTGVNGIRKTTSLYMPWFGELLQEALVSPETDNGETKTKTPLPVESLPTGSNSFFRQLDHMIATLCNEEFATLYRLTADLMEQDQQQQQQQQQQQSKNGGDDSHHDEPTAKPLPSADVIQQYSNLKAAIFSRYRTVSELLGVWLLRQAQQHRMNCLLETSGRDVAMFHYVNHFFPSHDKYNKLALRFQINHLDLAKRSVDERMAREMRVGAAAVASGDVFQVINANAGGPYGSQVLEHVERESTQVWQEEIVGNGGDTVARDWYKATIQINAYDTKPWTAQAVNEDGSLGKLYSFDAIAAPTTSASK